MCMKRKRENVFGDFYLRINFVLKQQIEGQQK